MKMPNGDQAFIAIEKLTGYLLALHHSKGAPKARYFRSLGFHESTVELLEHELLHLARTGEVETVERSVHGTKYVIDGDILSTMGEPHTVRTVWIQNRGEQTPRLVTAYPIRSTSHGDTGDS